MKTIIEMAHEAGFNNHELAYLVDNFTRFSELVIEQARVQPCCGNFATCQQICMPRAAANEREACAKACDELNFIDNGTPAGTRATNRHCAAAIRARGNT